MNKRAPGHVNLVLHMKVHSMKLELLTWQVHSMALKQTPEQEKLQDRACRLQAQQSLGLHTME